MHDSLDDKIDKLTSMMNKLTAKDNNQSKQFKPKFIKLNGEDNQEIIMIEVIMTREIIRIDTE